jgi:hypothetical protein
VDHSGLQKRLGWHSSAREMGKRKVGGSSNVGRLGVVRGVELHDFA